MLLDLTQIRQPDVDVSRRYDPSQFEGRGNQFRVVAPVDLRFKVHKDKQRFRLVGTVSSAVELTCSRCLEPFQQPIDAIFDLRYLPQSENAGEERQVEEDDLSEAFYRDDVIDLGQLIDEQFYLALPMKPLCSSDCRGLCPHCGTNLNLETCDCEVRWEDPRLAGLKAFMDRNKDNA
ncbi:MAG TPA: DUF177 domain-containing protein [Vicinamibacterales bacterium]|nr:DUF177 domain-containing protein [Vicinamibacterales bacterium]